MEFGVFSNGQRRNEIAAISYEQDLREIILADELGFTEAWISEHLSTPATPRPDRLPVADLLTCKAAGMTRQIRLGPAIRPLPFLHPFQVAMEAAVCDHLLQGRYQFGIGPSGSHSDQLQQRGIIVGEETPGERNERLHEALDFIMQCWRSEGPFDYSGKFWSGVGIRSLPKPYQKPHMPVGVASGSQTGGSVELAGRNGFMLLSHQFETAPSIRQNGDRYMAAGREAGLQPTRKQLRACRYVHVADSVEQAKSELRDGVTASIDFHKSRGRLQKMLPPGYSADDVNVDTLVEVGHLIVGDPDHVASQIAAFHEEAGGFGLLMLLTGHDYTEWDAFERSMRRFVADVAPQLRDLDADAVG
jgi:alkanesulfonate monooxygenase SsuD/methylene tetrahydromethanopterin reductase-like flavin-dependent oxidoreductase (luciferase family)